MVLRGWKHYSEVIAQIGTSSYLPNFGTPLKIALLQVWHPFCSIIGPISTLRRNDDCETSNYDLVSSGWNSVSIAPLADSGRGTDRGDPLCHI